MSRLVIQFFKINSETNAQMEIVTLGFDYFLISLNIC